MRRRVYNRLGEVLRKRRKDVLHITLTQAAEEVGITRAALHYIETGQATNPSFTSMINIARVYKMSLDELAAYVGQSYSR